MEKCSGYQRKIVILEDSLNWMSFNFFKIKNIFLETLQMGLFSYQIIYISATDYGIYEIWNLRSLNIHLQLENFS